MPEVGSESDGEVPVAAVELEHVVLVAPLRDLPGPRQHLPTHAAIWLTESPFDLQGSRDHQNRSPQAMLCRSSGAP